MPSLSIRRILRPMQTFILLGSLSLFTASQSHAQTVSLSSNCPTNPIFGVFYNFTAIGSVPTPQGAEWGGLTFDNGIVDPNTGLIQWESYYRAELFTPDAFNITNKSECFNSTPFYVRATGYFILNSNSGISYIYSNRLGIYYPI